MNIFCANINQSSSNPIEYYMGSSGTSEGVAMAAGVACLMRSVSKYLLTPTFGPNTGPEFKQDVHKSAYKILTFTADKIKDKGIMIDDINGIPVAKRFAHKNSNFP